MEAGAANENPFPPGYTRPASQQRMPLNHTALLYITLYPSAPPPFSFPQYRQSGTAAELLFFFLLSPAHVQDRVKISTVRGNWTAEAWFKNHRGNILCSQWWHQHMCTKPTRLHAWAFEWVEEEIESENVWGGKKRRKERLYGFHVSMAVIFSVMR